MAIETTGGKTEKCELCCFCLKIKEWHCLQHKRARFAQRTLKQLSKISRCKHFRLKIHIFPLNSFAFSICPTVVKKVRVVCIWLCWYVKQLNEQSIWHKFCNHARAQRHKYRMSFLIQHVLCFDYCFVFFTCQPQLDTHNRPLDNEARFYDIRDETINTRKSRNYF